MLLNQPEDQEHPCARRGKLTMQYVHEKYIVPALKFNTNALFTVMWLPPLLHAVKTWSQKKESDPCVMRELAAVLKCDFWHEQRHWRMGEYKWDEDMEQALGRKEEGKKGRKKGRNKLHSYPWVVFCTHVGGVNDIALI